MGTTALSVLQTKLQAAIADDKRVYWEHYSDALNNAIREVYPNLHRPLDDMSLITGNILPPFIWNADGDELDFYTEPTGALAKTTDGAYYRNGPNSALVTASGANDGIILDSNAFPRLLDLMDKTVSFKCWVISEDLSDAFLDVITTLSGSDTTESSTTTCPVGVLTLLELEDYSIPDDVERIRAKLRVKSDGKYVYFDPPRVIGMTLREYCLPKDFQDGHISQVYIQTSGYSDDICDDLHPSSWEKVYGWGIINDGSYKYLRLPAGYSNNRRIRLVGHCPLESLSATTDTISIDGEKPNLLIAYAAHLLFEMEMGVPSATDVSRYERLSVYWLNKYYRMLPQLKMATPSGTMKIAEW